MDSRGIELSEVIAFGGKLSAREDGFDLTYFKPCAGQDWREVAFKIEGTMFQAYIAALADNWRTYITLRSSMPSVHFSIDGKLGMKVESQGVLYYTLHLKSEAEVEAISGMLRAARVRGAELHQQVLARVNRRVLEDKRVSFARFKAGAQLGVSKNPNVIAEINRALALVRSKFQVEITSCRFHVANWFGRQAAQEFMEDIRRHGLDVFNEQADFVITWNDVN